MNSKMQEKNGYGCVLGMGNWIELVAGETV